MKKVWEHVAGVLNGVLGKEVLDLLENPKDSIHGDVAFPCFVLSKEWKLAPMHIAQDLAEKISPDDVIEKAVAMGPYLNFFIKSDFVARNVMSEILKRGKDYGKLENNGKTILIESPSPNTNKPLHLGHVRNMLLGSALDNVARHLGYNSVKVDTINNRGIHICKSMLAYDMFGNDAEPDKKSDHFVGDRYVRFAKENDVDPSLKDKAQEMLVKWENGDESVVFIWEKMNKWAMDGMKETYKRYGNRIDREYLESDIYKDGKRVVMDALDKGVFVKDEKGNVVFKIARNDGEFDNFVVLRADGTSVYATQDVALLARRNEDFDISKMIYVVGMEQEAYFQALFKVFVALGYEFAENCHHLKYGMIYLPDGRMKSRAGNVVDADNLADMMFAGSLEILKVRDVDHKLSDDELHRRSEIIAMSAIKFFMLKYEVVKDFVFDKDKSLSFEGDSGPYMLYTVARCSQIIKKFKNISDDIKFDLLDHELEKQILLKLAEFEDMLGKIFEEYKINLLARYVLDLSQLFNSYYQKVRILEGDIDVQNARVALLKCVRQVLEISLGMMGIEVLEEM